jgi:hypothetical protein
MTTIRLKSSNPRRHDHPDGPYLSRLSSDLPPLVFIMGDHRSGTTLLYQSLINTGAFDYTSAYHIVAADELLRNRIEGTEAAVKAALSEEFERYVGSDRVIDGIPVSTETPEEYGFVLQNAGVGHHITARNLPYFRQFVAKMGFLGDGSRPLLLKSPWDFGNFVPIHEWFPTAKFVFLHREPEAIISSKLRVVRTVLKGPNAYMAKLSRHYAQMVEKPWIGAALRWLVSVNWVAKRMVRQSKGYVDYYFQNIAKIPESQRVELSYQGLCHSPNETIERILEAVGVESATELKLDETIKPRKLALDPLVDSLKPLIESKFARYYDFLQTLNADAAPFSTASA